MAVKKNVQQNRKAFVQAKLGQTGVEATPEQRAKLRERFNTLSQTKEGRTKIAKALLPGGSAAERKALKSSVRPPQTDTGSTNKDTNKVVTSPGMGGARNNVSLPVGSAATSAFIPNSMTTKDMRYSPSAPTGTKPVVPSSKTVLIPIKNNAKESFGIPGKTYSTSGQKTLALPDKGRTPIVTDPGMSLRGMQGQGGFDPSVKNTLRAVSAAVGVAAIQSAIPAIMRVKAAERLAAFDYYGSTAGQASAKIPDSLTKQNTVDLTKRAFKFYKNLTKTK